MKYNDVIQISCWGLIKLRWKLSSCDNNSTQSHLVKNSSGILPNRDRLGSESVSQWIIFRCWRKTGKQQRENYLTIILISFWCERIFHIFNRPTLRTSKSNALANDDVERVEIKNSGVKEENNGKSVGKFVFNLVCGRKKQRSFSLLCSLAHGWYRNVRSWKMRGRKFSRQNLFNFFLQFTTVRDMDRLTI